MKTLGVALLLGAAIGTLYAMSASPASSYHRVWLAQKYDFDKNQPGYTLANYAWAVQGQGYHTCSDFTTQPQAWWDALYFWYNAVNAQFGQEFGANDCGSPTIWLLDSAVHPGISDFCATQGACYEMFMTWDSARGGYYIQSANIWLNGRDYTFTHNGVFSAISHELGHIYGLDEAYNENNPYFNACVNDPNRPTIMDTLVTDANGVIVQGCDSIGRTQYDLDRVWEFNAMNTFPPRNLTSYKTSTNVMYDFWDDASPSESGYRMYAYYWTGTYWYQYSSRFHINGVAPGDPWQTSSLSEPFVRPTGYPINWYIQCMYVESKFAGDIHWSCFPRQWLGGGAPA